MSKIDPLSLREFGKLLAVGMDDRPHVWIDAAAFAGRGEGAVTMQGSVHLLITWDRTDPAPPHVCLIKGSYLVTGEVPAGATRLGHLVSITPPPPV